MVNHELIQKQVKIILPKDWDKDTNKKGKFLENLVADLLSKMKFTVEQRVSLTGMEIDIIAKNSGTNKKAFVECKFIKEPFSTDVIWKLLGKTWHQDISYAYLFSTAQPGQDAKGVIKEIRDKQDEKPDRKPTLVFVGPEELADWFIDVKRIALPDLSQRLVKVITLLITPTQNLWVAEEIKEGDTEPFRLIIFPTSEKCQINKNELRNDFLRYNIWGNLDLVDGTETKVKQQHPGVYELEKEVVSSIGRADAFDDYRPCNPENFVGRHRLQSEFWKLLASIRDGKTQTRIVCFTAGSGFGKSSLVVKLVEDCRQNEALKHDFYLYDVDVRSAKGAFFVKKAIMLALQKAVDENFIDLPEHKISIESTEQQLFYSQSIKKALEKLKSDRRFIVVFFDQFETILTKESFSGVYKAFEEVAREVSAFKENLLLGFCWRTDVSTYMRHPAYNFWHQLSEHRREFELKEFDNQESRDFLKHFKNYLRKHNQKLETQEENFINDQCPGFPWLYTMVRGDVYEKKLTGNSGMTLWPIDVKGMFNKNIKKYVNTSEQLECLKYIAKKPTVEMNDVIDKFGNDVIEWLASNRLVIQLEGHKYAISWDIYRDILNGKEEPFIPFIYIPKHPITTVIKFFNLIKNKGSRGIPFSEVVEASGYKEATINNITRDLYNFGLISRRRNQFIAQDNLVNLGSLEIADYLANQLEKHTIIKTIYEKISPGDHMTLNKFRDVVANAPYTKESLNPKTPNDNAARIISWFCFAGLLEYRDQWWIVRPKGNGKDKGKLNNKDGEQLSLFDDLGNGIL